MKELVFNVNSWHYKLAKWAGYKVYDDQLEICAYTRRVVLGFLLIGLIFVVTYIVALALVEMLFGLFFSLLIGAWIVSTIGEITLIVVSTIIASISLFWIMEKASNKYFELKNRLREEKANKPDGFVEHAYKSWKEKYCARIKIVRDDGQKVNSWDY